MMVVNVRDRRIWLAGGIVALVLFLAAGWYCLSGGDAPEQPALSPEKNLEKNIVSKLEEKRGQKGFFSEYRMERESLRGKQMEMLSQILNDPGVDKLSRQAASMRMVQISEDMEKEMKAESLIKSRGFSDCVVITQGDAVTVVIAASQLSPGQEAEVRQVMGYPKSQGSKLLLTLIEP